MKHRQSLFILFAALCAIVVTVVIVVVTIYGTDRSTITDARKVEEIVIEDQDSEIEPDVVYPLYLTTMTHMEGDWDFLLEAEAPFLKQVEKLEFGMDIAEDYGAILTVETEEPFARANTKWDLNIMKEILDRGHGVGSHCDRGSRGSGTYDELVEELRLVKSLVDDLVGAENDKGCSGTGGPTDWAQALVEAGFEYVDGVVGFHMLAFPLSERPEGWDDLAIYQDYYHENVPVDLEERIHLMRLANTLDWNADDTGIVVSAGDLGQLTYIAEGDRNTCVESGCEMTMEDVEVAVAAVIEASELHDPSRVGKITFYFPTENFVEGNEDVLRAFFSEMQRLEKEGVIKWASQLQVYETFLQWEATETQ